jgi:adenylate cyclase
MVQLLYELAILGEYNLSYRWVTTGDISNYFLINTLSFLLNGLIAGLFIVYLLLDWIRNRSYTQGIMFAVFIYTTFFFIMTCVQNYFVTKSMWDGRGSYAAAYWDGLSNYFFSYEFVRNFPFWLIILVGTIITILVNDKYGPGIFMKFLLGHYFKPANEERIFMFLDLKGATGIAEKLGESRYFSFLQATYKDITKVILKRKAEVYQYVGDEIVLSWDLATGVRDLNCIRCFLDIRSLLEKLAPQYKSDFGAVPRFKAGLHVGRVTVGEIGVIKRDIAYSGDVLNTTARIQAKCNELGKELLFSKDLFEILPAGHMVPESIGNVVLRGKKEGIFLYSVQ